VNSYISFSPGLNLIIGPNGSGKSSILQAIGLGFFGITNKVNLSKFITNDVKNDGSTIKIEFDDGDGMNYTLTREISSRQSRVRLVDDRGMIVDNATKVGEKIKQIFQIDSNDPEEIYKNIITAYQNDITDVFDRTPAKRNEFFNTLFNTEIYKFISSTHVKNYTDKLDKDLGDLTVKAQYLESEIEKEKSLDDLMAEIKKEMEKVQKAIQDSEAQKSEIGIFIDEQTKISDKIKMLSSKKSTLDVKIESLQKQIEKLSKDAEGSQQSARILEKYIQDYNRYNEISEKVKKTNDEISEIMKSLDLIQSVKDNINLKKNQKEKIISNIESDKKRIGENQEAMNVQSREIAFYSETADDLKVGLLKANELYKSISEEIKEIKMNLAKKNYRAISSRFDSEDKMVFDMLSGKIEEQEKLRTLLDQKNESITETRSKIKTLDEAKSTLSNGICPYLKEKCLNIKGDPAAYFDPRIKALDDELSNLKKQKSEIDESIKKNEQMEDERSTLVEKLLDEKNQKGREVYQKTAQIQSDINLQKKQIDLLEKRKAELNLTNENLGKDISEMAKEIDVINEDIDGLSVKIAKENDLKEKINILQEDRSKDQEEMQKVKAGYELYNQNLMNASRLDKIKRELEVAMNEKSELESEIHKISDEIEESKNSYKAQDLQTARSKIDRLNEEIGSLRQKLGELNGSISEMLKTKKAVEEKKSQLEEIKSTVNKISTKISFSKSLRNLLDDMGSKISSTYRDLISSKATDKYNMMTKRSDIVKWAQDYDLHLLTYNGGTLSDRNFEMLSGGEQMSLALAMRMAMSAFFSRSGFAIFDEPTVNLDADRRSALSESLPELLEDMDQVIIVTHDDSFKEMTEKIIILKNIDGVTTVEN
jgi:exonuclease SbcC